MNWRWLIIPATVVALAGLWHLSLGRSMVETEKELEINIRAEQQKIATYQEILSRFHEQIEMYHEDRDRSDTGHLKPLSGQEEITALYLSLDSLCNEPAIKLHEITPSLEETINFLKQWPESDTSFSMPIRIKIDAEYRSLARLVEAIEKHRHFYAVQSCRINGSGKLFPDCALDLTIITQLEQPVEMIDRE